MAEKEKELNEYFITMNQALKLLKDYPSTTTREAQLKKNIHIAMGEFIKDQLPRFRKIKKKAGKVNANALNWMYLM